LDNPVEEQLAAKSLLEAAKCREVAANYYLYFHRHYQYQANYYQVHHHQ
jgi:hypothetical protein